MVIYISPSIPPNMQEKMKRSSSILNSRKAPSVYLDKAYFRLNHELCIKHVDQMTRPRDIVFT